MGVIVRAYRDSDVPAMRLIWNTVVEEGNAFPQTSPLSPEEAGAFFAEQSHTGVAELGGEIVGLYILHPNNVGRCGHIANTSYAVKAGRRGQHIGEALVKDSLAVAASLSFALLQFNAVVALNAGAIHLYNKLGFTQLGTIPGGFLMPDGSYADIILFYIKLV